MLIIDLAGPPDYGATVQPVRCDLAGMNIGDERQNQVPDCYARAVVDSILIHYGAAALARNYQVQPDGNVDVRFYRSATAYDYLVTPAINPWWGDPNSGYDGANGDAAGDILQKAFAAFRTTAGTIAGTGWGTDGEFMADLGWTPRTIDLSISAIEQALAAGAIVDLSTGYSPPAGVPADHSVSVVSYDAAAGTLTAYDPWGSGYESIGFPAYVTFSSLAGFDEAWSALPGGAPAPAPEPATLPLVVLPAAFLLLLRRRACPE